MKTKILIILCVVVLAACKKKQEPMPELSIYLSKTTQPFGVSTFNYDAQNRMQTRVFLSSNEASNGSYISNYIYDTNNRVIERHFDMTNPTSPDYVYKNTYDAEGRVVSENYINKTTGALISSKTFTYNPKTVLVERKDATGTLLGTDLITFTTDGKNYVKYESFGPSGTLYGTQAFSGYDDKKNFTVLFPVGMNIPALPANNYSTQFVTNNSTGATATVNLSYEYNADGYITKRINGTSVETFEYIKK